MSVERGTSCISFLPETLLLTSDWPHNHHRLVVLRGPTPHVQHPPVRPPLTSTVTFSAYLLTPLVLRTHFQVSPLPHEVAAGWISLQLPLVFYTVCALLLSPWLLNGPLLTLICGHRCYHGQSELLTCLCLLCPPCFSL
jgi:hypothetical protein